MGLVPVVALHAVELHARLGVVRIDGEQQPAVEVSPTEAFESKLHGTLTAHLVHKLMIVGNILTAYMSGTDAVAKGIDSLLSGLAEVGRLSLGPTVGSASLGIHQIDIGQTHVRQVRVERA